MNYLFTCGGTAGHINPAIAVAGKLREIDPDCGILFVGAEGHMEENLVPREGYPIKTVKITNISRAKSLKGLKHNVDTVKNVIEATKTSKEIIKEFKPDAAIGTGGYVCYPVLTAAGKMGVATLVHESNAVPGLTTKMLSDKVDRILLGFEESRQYYKDGITEVTGTPVRGSFDQINKAQAKKELGIAEDQKLVVSVWGSLGSSHMNGVMAEMIGNIHSTPSFRLIHATGKSEYEKTLKKIEELSPNYEDFGLEVRDYIYDMSRVMAAADLILCRAGASTLAELTYMGKPAILIPSPNVTNNHQEKNARVLENAGGAKVLLEGQFDAPQLFDMVSEILKDEQQLEEMSAAMKSLAVPDATDKIARLVMELAAEKKD